MSRQESSRSQIKYSIVDLLTKEIPFIGDVYRVRTSGELLRVVDVPSVHSLLIARSYSGTSSQGSLECLVFDLVARPVLEGNNFKPTPHVEASCVYETPLTAVTSG